MLYNSPNKFSGKEQLTALETSGSAASTTYDFGARWYSPRSARWSTMDPLAEKYYSISPYTYCAGNPINLVDPTGRDWFYFSVNGEKPNWHWIDGNKYYTGTYDSNGNEIVLTGVEAVVSFSGARYEQLGKNKNGTYGYINGDGAIIANVTVYGPKGENDIHHFRGYTMTSNPSEFGAIHEGTYNANYLFPGKSGQLPSNWVLEQGGKVKEIDGGINPSFPKQIYNGQGYKKGIFIHSTNRDGWAYGRVSTGCLLIHTDDWTTFNKSLSGVTNFLVQLERFQRVSIPGIVDGWGFGPVESLRKN